MVSGNWGWVGQQNEGHAHKYVGRMVLWRAARPTYARGIHSHGSWKSGLHKKAYAPVGEKGHG